MQKVYGQNKRTESGERLIKQYANRKLYDSVISEYIGLAELFDLVRNGEKIKVIHNITKTDITTKMLLSAIRAVEDKHEDIMLDDLYKVATTGRGTFVSFVGSNA